MRKFVLSKIDAADGELSIVDDIIQEANVYAMERPESHHSMKILLMRGAENYIKKHRETGYKVKLWQDSADDRFSGMIWGENPDID